jgi:hypothetical protein
VSLAAHGLGSRPREIRLRPLSKRFTCKRGEHMAESKWGSESLSATRRAVSESLRDSGLGDLTVEVSYGYIIITMSEEEAHRLVAAMRKK